MPVVVGRSHQQGFFEGLLHRGAGQQYLCTISRSHFQVLPMEGEALGTFEVINLSMNFILVNRRRLGKGERAMLRPGDCIDFAATGTSGEQAVFLTFRLEKSAGLAGEEQPAGVPDLPWTPPRSPQTPEASWQRTLLAAQPQSPASDGRPAQPSSPPWPPQPPENTLKQTLQVPASDGQLMHPSSHYLPQSSAGFAAPYRLVCTEAFGSDAMALEAMDRTIPVPVDGPLAVGRQHQVGFFENLLGDDINGGFLCRISRSHLEVSPAASGPPGCFAITNLSSNPVVLRNWPDDEGLNGQQLDQHAQGEVRPGHSIDFIAASPDGSEKVVVYLQLFLEDANGPPVTPRKAQDYAVNRDRRRKKNRSLICA